MRLDPRIVFATLAGILSATIDALFAVGILPLIGRYAGVEAVRLWLSAATLVSVVLFIQSGLAYKIIRRVSTTNFAEQGSQARLPSEYLSECYGAILIALSSMAFVSIVALLYVMPSLDTDAEKANFLKLWVLYSGGTILNVGGQLGFSILNGLGKVGIDKIVRSALVAVQVALLYFLLVETRSVVAVGFSYLITGILNLTAALWCIKRIANTSGGISHAPAWAKGLKLFASSRDLFASNLCALIITAVIPLYLQRNLGVEEFAKFAVPGKYLSALSFVALLISQASMPRMIKLSNEGNIEEMRKYFGASLMLGGGVYILGWLIIMCTPHELRKNLSGGVQVSIKEWFAVGLFYATYVTNAICANTIYARNGSALVGYAALNAALALLIAIPTMQHYGASGAAFGLFIASLPVSGLIIAAVNRIR